MTRTSLSLADRVCRLELVGRACVPAHHAFLTRLLLDRIEALLPARDLLEIIPGFSQIVAEVGRCPCRT
ncbi:MAG TPA: hypothetical protein VII33_02685 [Nakamurella sp.]